MEMRENSTSTIDFLLFQMILMISKSTFYVKEYSLDIFPIFLDISALTTSRYWYLKEHFLGLHRFNALELYAVISLHTYIYVCEAKNCLCDIFMAINKIGKDL